MAQCKTDYHTSSDAMRFSVVLTDWRNKEMFDQRGTRRDTDIGARERRWNAIKSRCSGYISQIGSFDIPFMRHHHDFEY